MKPFSIGFASDQNGREDPRNRFWEHGYLCCIRGTAVASRPSSRINVEAAWNQKEQVASDTEHGPAPNSLQ